MNGAETQPGDEEDELGKGPWDSEEKDRGKTVRDGSAETGHGR